MTLNRRQSNILDVIGDYSSQPLTAQEIGHVLGETQSTIRKDLAKLLENGYVFSRIETVEERTLRYGQMARSTRAALYSTRSVVPPRTARQAVPGFVREAKNNERSMRPSEINTRLFNFLKKRGKRGRFTVLGAADATGLETESIRRRTRELELLNVIERTGHNSGSVEFRVVSQRELADYFGVEDELDFTPPEVPAVPEPAAPPLSPAFAAQKSPEDRVRAILAENEKLRARVAELEAHVARTSAALSALSTWEPLSD